MATPVHRYTITQDHSSRSTDGDVDIDLPYPESPRAGIEESFKLLEQESAILSRSPSPLAAASRSLFEAQCGSLFEAPTHFHRALLQPHDTAVDDEGICTLDAGKKAVENARDRMTNDAGGEHDKGEREISLSGEYFSRRSRLHIELLSQVIVRCLGHLLICSQSVDISLLTICLPVRKLPYPHR